MKLETGQKFVGLGHWKGWEFEIRSIEPETPERCGQATIYTSKQPPCLLDSCRASIDYYQDLGYDVSERIRRLTEPKIEQRELRWFEEWKRHGLILKVSP